MTLEDMKSAIADECDCSVQDVHQAALIAIDAFYRASDFYRETSSRMSTDPGSKRRIPAMIRIKKEAFNMKQSERKAR